MSDSWPPRPGEEKCIIGMIDLLPMPGAPVGGRRLDEVMEQAVADAQALEAGGADAALVQNRGDKTFPAKGAPPNVVAAMGAVTSEVIRATSLPVEVHVLHNDTTASLAVAHVSGVRFVRVAVLTGSSPSAQGLLDSDPHAVLRYRRSIGAEGTALFADVASMHKETPADKAPKSASDAVYFGAAGAVVVAHPSTEGAVTLAEAVRSRVEVPVLIGGYSNHENVFRLLEHADGAIVGGAFKKDADQEGIDSEKVRSHVRLAREG